MNLETILTVAGAIAGIYTVAQFVDQQQAEANSTEWTPERLNNLYRTVGDTHGVEPALLKAVARTESDERPREVNPETGVNGKSYGLMQILCPQQLPAIDNFPPENCQRLINDVPYNVEIGAKILKWNIENYGKWKGVATYNATSARSAPPEGPFPNDDYVGEVQNWYQQYKPKFQQ